MKTENERLFEVRTKLGLTQREFAEALSIGQSTVTMAETGKRKLSDKTAKLICATYGVSLQWLKTGEGSMMDLNDDDLLTTYTPLKSDDEELKALVLEICKLSIAERKAMKKLIKKLDRIFNPETYQDETE
jgi:transcriptional regulator with XRE-family HTH domain